MSKHRRKRPVKKGRKPRSPVTHRTDAERMAWRPADYKPSWNPDAICPVCGKPIGLQYMAVRHKGSTDEFHADCLTEAELRRRLGL